METEKSADSLLDTKPLLAALPDGKTPEQRPKYVQILQEKSGQRAPSTPSKSPAALGASSSGTDSAKSKGKPGKNNYPKNQAANGKRPFRYFPRKPEVVPLPENLETHELSVSPDNVLFFSGPGHYLSALYPVKVIVDGNEYNSVEHYYQACKLYTLVGKDSAAELMAATTPIEVKKATKELLKNKASSKAISAWKSKDSIAVLKHAITQKFAQHEDLKRALLETGNKILIQTYIGDTFFAAGANVKYTTTWISHHLNQSLKVPEAVNADNVKYLPLIANGKNALGWILMQVRHELRTAQPA